MRLTFDDGSSEILTVSRSFAFAQNAGLFIADLVLEATDDPHVAGITTPSTVRHHVTSCEELPTVDPHTDS